MKILQSELIIVVSIATSVTLLAPAAAQIGSEKLSSDTSAISQLAHPPEPHPPNHGLLRPSAFHSSALPLSAWGDSSQAPNSRTQPGEATSTGDKNNAKETTSVKTGKTDSDVCAEKTQCQFTDCRGVFASSFYIGLAIDTFAGDDTLLYMHPNASGDIHERAIGGIDFAYRLVGDPKPKVGSQRHSWHPNNLWIYGETVHGVRSADVNCTENPKLLVCKDNNGIDLSNPGEQFYEILRNATTLEGFLGLRWEFMGLQQQSSSPANLYIAAQAGFLSVAGAPGSALDVDHIALGAVATKGDYENSYLEVGFGRSDNFATARRRRVKVDGYLERSLAGDGAFSLFAQLLVDTDLGHGSDSIQSFIGLNFDLKKIVDFANGNGSGENKDQTK